MLAVTDPDGETSPHSRVSAVFEASPQQPPPRTQDPQ